MLCALCIQSTSSFCMQLTIRGNFTMVKNETSSTGTCTLHTHTYHSEMEFFAQCQNGAQQRSSEGRTAICMRKKIDRCSNGPHLTSTKQKYAIGFSTFQTLYSLKFYLIIILFAYSQPSTLQLVFPHILHFTVPI